MFSRRYQEEKEQERSDFYWSLELTEDTFQTLEKLLHGEKVQARALERLRTCIQFARRMELPLVGLPWGKLKEQAQKRHSSEVDAIWDWKRQ